ncbi:hypothetical protein L2E82_05036 [Cichorium intybus]|uniref:Uncharacterized protein n=2 Tax=Cichorium intybus TaxID=13427 RepID=A0ACB8ZM41_CICIN|nr:hypothetical protein L2E82_42572 [Cichorium intybus]KAI3791302.1 hypothetical protein L2E82_05036 [Cichorium intybus]
MKIQCDLSVYCIADEASLCTACDYRVHHANKLANKHMRFSILHPSFNDSPRCDICKMVTIPGMMISSSDGPRSIPVIAMGTTSESGLLGNDDVVKSSTITEAIKLGYRHFDTAPICRTEKPLGEAVREALRLGLIKSRGKGKLRI